MDGNVVEVEKYWHRGQPICQIEEKGKGRENGHFEEPDSLNENNDSCSLHLPRSSQANYVLHVTDCDLSIERSGRQGPGVEFSDGSERDRSKKQFRILKSRDGVVKLFVSIIIEKYL